MSPKMCVDISQLIYAFPYRGWMLMLAVKLKLIGDQSCGFSLKYSRISLRIKLFIVFIAAKQSGGSETTAIIIKVYYIS